MTLTLDSAKRYADIHMACVSEIERLRFVWAMSSNETEKSVVRQLSEVNREQAQIALLILTRFITEEQGEAMILPLFDKEKQLKAFLSSGKPAPPKLATR